MLSKLSREAPEQYEYIKNAITDYLKANPDTVEKYETGKFERADRVKDLQVRFSFDLTFNVPGLNQYVCDHVFSKGFTSDHLGTALNEFVPKVIRRY